MKCRCGLSYVDHEYGIIFKNKYTRFAFEDDRSIRMSNRLSFESVTVISLQSLIMRCELFTYIRQESFTPFSTLGAKQFRMNNVYRKFHLHNRDFITWVRSGIRNDHFRQPVYFGCIVG
jgi:hypothetical protein